MRRLEAVVYREARRWIVWVPDLDAVTQAASRREVGDIARDLIAIWLDVPLRSVPAPRLRFGTGRFEPGRGPKARRVPAERRRS